MADVSQKQGYHFGIFKIYWKIVAISLPILLVYFLVRGPMIYSMIIGILTLALIDLIGVILLFGQNTIIIDDQKIEFIRKGQFFTINKGDVIKVKPLDGFLNFLIPYIEVQLKTNTFMKVPVWETKELVIEKLIAFSDKVSSATD